MTKRIDLSTHERSESCRLVIDNGGVFDVLTDCDRQAEMLLLALAVAWTGYSCRLRSDGRARDGSDFCKGTIRVIQTDKVSRDAFYALATHPALLKFAAESGSVSGGGGECEGEGEGGGEDESGVVGKLHHKLYGKPLHFYVDDPECVDVLVGTNFQRDRYQVIATQSYEVDFVTMMAGAEPQLSPAECRSVMYNTKGPYLIRVVTVTEDGFSNHCRWLSLPEEHTSVLAVTCESIMIAVMQAIENCDEGRAQDELRRICLLGPACVRSLNSEEDLETWKLLELM